MPRVRHTSSSIQCCEKRNGVNYIWVNKCRVGSFYETHDVPYCSKTPHTTESLVPLAPASYIKKTGWYKIRYNAYWDKRTCRAKAELYDQYGFRTTFSRDNAPSQPTVHLLAPTFCKTYNKPYIPVFTTNKIWWVSRKLGSSMRKHRIYKSIYHGFRAGEVNVETSVIPSNIL